MGRDEAWEDVCEQVGLERKVRHMIFWNQKTTSQLKDWCLGVCPSFILLPCPFGNWKLTQTYLVLGPLVPKQKKSVGSVDSGGFSWLRQHGFNFQQGQSCLYVHVRSELESPIPPVVFGDLRSISWEPNDLTLTVFVLPKDIIPLTKDGRECVPWHWCEVVSCSFWVLLNSMFHSPCPSGCAW